jgi:hypothetical protein
MNFLDRFSKNDQTYLYKLFNAEKQTEIGTDIMNRLSQFRYAITNALHIYRKIAKFLALLQTDTLLSVRLPQLYTTSLC